MLIDYKRNKPGDKKYKKYLNRRLELRNKIDETIAYHYSKGNPVISHFFHNSKPVPLWAYFEVISFGSLETFYTVWIEIIKSNLLRNSIFIILE